MSQTKTALLILKGTLSELESYDQDKARRLVEQARTIAKEAGDLAPLVIGIVMHEIILESEE